MSAELFQNSGDATNKCTDPAQAFIDANGKAAPITKVIPADETSLSATDFRRCDQGAHLDAYDLLGLHAPSFLSESLCGDCHVN